MPVPKKQQLVLKGINGRCCIQLKTVPLCISPLYAKELEPIVKKRNPVSNSNKIKLKPYEIVANRYISTVPLLTPAALENLRRKNTAGGGARSNSNDCNISFSIRRTSWALNALSLTAEKSTTVGVQTSSNFAATYMAVTPTSWSCFRVILRSF